MLLVGLTGGIGSGKSTVAAHLAERGAIVLDADAIVHDLQRPGTEVFSRIVDRFGASVVAPDGTLDRSGLAALVFDDPTARADLNAIVHPEVWVVMSARLEELKDSHEVVVLDVPLLVEGRGKDLVDVVVVVQAPEEIRLRRVMAARDMTEDEVRARMGAQASAEERRALADHVIDNAGDEAALRARTDDLWAILEERTR